MEPLTWNGALIWARVDEVMQLVRIATVLSALVCLATPAAANSKAATAKRKCSQPNGLPSGCVVSGVLLKESLPLSQSTDHLCQTVEFPGSSDACPLLMSRRGAHFG